MAEASTKDESVIIQMDTDSDEHAFANNASWFSVTKFIVEKKETAFTAINWVRKKGRQSWVDFFNFAMFAYPNPSGAFPRILKNLDHFFSNYMCVLLIILLYGLITSILVILTALAFCGLCYSIHQRSLKGPIRFYGITLPSTLLYSLATMVSIPLFYLAGASNLLCWVGGVGILVVLVHALFYANEETPGTDFEKEPVHIEVK